MIMGEAKDSGFKSYIDESGLESISLNETQKTKLLVGETVVCEVENILMYRPLSDKKKSTSGVLTITTFKLSFACAEEESDWRGYIQHNNLLGLNDICLSSIDTIYQVGDKTKKKLLPGQNVSGKVKELLIVCKNMRTFEFNFKYAAKDGGKNVANVLLHHCYPKRHSLLFAYEYGDLPSMKCLSREARLFRTKEDWRLEYNRTKCKNWRISDVNQNFRTSHMLVESLIVPQSLTDSTLTQAVEHFRNRCGPVWVWGTPLGAALVRMADLLPTITDRTQENALLEHIRKSHPDKKPPYLIDLGKDCPSPKDVHNSYVKLRDLCVPDSTRQFKQQDYKFYGLLDNSRWLAYVSTCLGKAVEAAEQLSVHNSTVVLQEGNGTDMNCVISSLIQIILDPLYRSKYGFQSLIQKEWVAMGHQFAFRMGHILDKEVEFCPLFLLFLDCVWQLLQQFPVAFKISETYLTTLWDSVGISIFDTFLFNCEHDRVVAEQGQDKLILRSVWDWHKQFGERDIAFFCNPLYLDTFTEKLTPQTGISSLGIWSQCYFRWLPDLEIRCGGKPQIDLWTRMIVSEVWELKEKTEGRENGMHLKNREEYLKLLSTVNSFYPFSHNAKEMTINNVLLINSDALDTQSILNMNTD
ncbi:myotubularin-related protein 10-A [Harmonia axyridis]|uniref:myotubularin-related protein 10-A n=1 Tax=Harmonia axyridis TaxID=115357 RepID=UPI001E278939|nr:myotubularin-related protein 10-A [Harmonia axyridis]